MQNDSDNSLSRRNFLKTAARTAAGAALAAIAISLLSRGGEKSGQSCSGGGLCRNCQSYSDCKLPEAELNRRADADQEASRGR